MNKKKVLREWGARFPELSPVGGKLLRRVGPLVQGIALPMGTDGTYYRSVAFVHVLLRESPNLSLGLPVELKNEYFTEVSDVDTIIRRLRGVCELSFEGTLALRAVVKHYRSYYEANPYFFVLTNLEDVALLTSYFDRPELLSEWIDFATAVIRGWPERVRSGLPPAEEWARATREAVRDVSQLRKVVETETERHKLLSATTSELTVI